MTNTDKEYLTIDAMALDPLILSFAPAAKKTLLYSFIEISENIDDDFHRTAVKDLLDARISTLLKYSRAVGLLSALGAAFPDELPEGVGLSSRGTPRVKASYYVRKKKNG